LHAKDHPSVNKIWDTSGDLILGQGCVLDELYSSSFTGKSNVSPIKNLTVRNFMNDCFPYIRATHTERFTPTCI
jgi:hypothetical protein